MKTTRNVFLSIAHLYAIGKLTWFLFYDMEKYLLSPSGQVFSRVLSDSIGDLGQKCPFFDVPQNNVPL